MSQHAGLQHLSQANTPEQMDYEVPLQPTISAAKNVVFKLVKNVKGNIHIDGYHENVTNPKTKKLDTLRLIKGVYTIWKSEQEEQKVDEKYLQRNRRSIKVTNNVAILPNNDVTAIEFMRAVPHNVEVGGNKGTRFSFFEYNPEKQAEAASAKRAQRRKAVKLAEDEKDFGKVKKHANYLGIPFVDRYGFEKSEKALRTEYEDYAEQQPDKFMKSVGSPEIEVAFLIRKALSEGKIDLGRQPNTAYWADDGGYICRIPANNKAQEYLIEFALLPQDPSKQFISQLQSKIM